MHTVLHQSLTRVAMLFNSPLFKIGETSVSISSIVQIVLSLLVVIFLVRIFRNLIKRWLLVKLGIDEGNREAIATIISYSAATLGILLVLQSTGLNLTSLAVLAGGLGIGIGFGLQNLIKDLISGLILVMERSIKVGDFLEFGLRQEFTGLQGTVKEISLRFTSIQTKDGAKLLVPNSYLVQAPILNWSYKSIKSRLITSLRVDSSSDLVLVTEILLKAAQMEPNVLKEPSPQVIFKGFVEGYIDLELRVWISKIEDENEIKSSLNFIVEYTLRQHGITIPFPSKNLWLRNSKELFTSFEQEENVQRQLLKQENRSSKLLSLKDLLKQVSYFTNFTDLELRQLIEIGYQKRLYASEVLFRENEPGDAFYIVLSGSVEVLVEKLSKRLSILQCGDFLGELSLMLGIPRSATVRALEETTLFGINHQGFKKFLQEQPGLTEVIIQELGKHQEELSERRQQLRELGFLDTTEYNKSLIDWVQNQLKNLFGL